MIFLDVGAHRGQTLTEVTKPAYGFRVFAFEPMPKQYDALVATFGGNPDVTLFNYGLSDRTGPLPLYGSNRRLESSIYPSKVDVDAGRVTVCEFVSASEFLRSTLAGEDGLIVKLNCEGAEVPILDDLIDSGEIWRCANIMIDFDIRKVAGYEHEEARILERLAVIGFDRYSLSEDVMVGVTHQERIAAWLRRVLP